MFGVTFQGRSPEGYVMLTIQQTEIIEQAGEIIDGEIWVQLSDGRWGIRESFQQRLERLRATGHCPFCGHTHKRIGEHIELCKNGMCPDTHNSISWPRERKNVNLVPRKKPLCLSCYSDKYLTLGLSLEPLDDKTALCEDCKAPSDLAVTLQVEPDGLGHFTLSPGKGRHHGIPGLSQDKDEFVKSLRH